MLTIGYELLLVIAFFVAFKFYDIYIATITIMVGAAIQVMLTRFSKGRFDKKQLIVMAILFVFGGMTLYFHDPIFIKWKPTVVFWILGMVFLISQFVGKIPLAQRMLSHALQGGAAVPAVVWKRLNLAWAIFFLLLGTANVFVAYYLSTDSWVNFKVYGVLGSLLLFGIGQSFLLTRYIAAEKQR